MRYYLISLSLALSSCSNNKVIIEKERIGSALNTSQRGGGDWQIVDKEKKGQSYNLEF